MSIQVPVVMPEHLIDRWTIGDLAVGRGGWVPVNALLVDLAGRCWRQPDWVVAPAVDRGTQYWIYVTHGPQGYIVDLDYSFNYRWAKSELPVDERGAAVKLIPVTQLVNIPKKERV